MNFLSKRILCKLTLSLGICLLCEQAILSQSSSVPYEYYDTENLPDNEALTYVWQIDDPDLIEPGEIPSQFSAQELPPLDFEWNDEQLENAATIASDYAEEEPVSYTEDDSFLYSEDDSISYSEGAPVFNEESPLLEDASVQNWMSLPEGVNSNLGDASIEEGFLSPLPKTTPELPQQSTAQYPSSDNYEDKSLLESVSVETRIPAPEVVTPAIGVTPSDENVPTTAPKTTPGLPQQRTAQYPDHCEPEQSPVVYREGFPQGIATLEARKVQEPLTLSQRSELAKAKTLELAPSLVVVPSTSSDPLLAAPQNLPWPRLLPEGSPAIFALTPQEIFENTRLKAVSQKDAGSKHIGKVADAAPQATPPSAGTPAVRPTQFLGRTKPAKAAFDAQGKVTKQQQEAPKHIGEIAETSLQPMPAALLAGTPNPTPKNVLGQKQAKASFDAEGRPSSQQPLPAASLGQLPEEEPLPSAVLAGTPWPKAAQSLGKQPVKPASIADASATVIKQELVVAQEIGKIEPEHKLEKPRASSGAPKMLSKASVGGETNPALISQALAANDTPLNNPEDLFTLPKQTKASEEKVEYRELPKATPVKKEPSLQEVTPELSIPSPAASPAQPKSAAPAPATTPSVQATPTVQPVQPIPVQTPAAAAVPPNPVTPPAEAQTTETAQGPLINFNNVAMIEYLNFVSKLTGKNFIFDDADLDFRVTIISSEPTTVEHVMAALLQELRIHGLSLMEVGNNLIIHRNYKVNTPATIVSGDGKTPNTDLITQIFRLNNATPDKIADIIRPMLSELALVESDPDTSHLIVTDITTNVVKIATLIKTLDEPISGIEIGQYVVQNASLDSIILLAQQILAPIAGGKPLVFVPHTATNSIYIVSSAFLVERAIAVLQHLDNSEGETRILTLERLAAEQAAAQKGQQQQQPLSPEAVKAKRNAKWNATLPLGHVESTKFYIRKLQYQKGDQIVTSLQGVADSLLASAAQNTNLITTINSIQWIEPTNSLVYTGTEESIAKVTELINEIDVPLQQVLIEMLIIETTVQDSLNFGVDWGARFSENDVAGAEAFLSANSPLTLALDGTANTGNPINPNGLARLTGFNLGVIGRNVTRCGLSFSSVGALVSALHSDTKTNIVLNPKIVVEDNSPAEIFVGINTSFQTQAIANDQGSIITSNFEFRDVGSTLRVTPMIGSNGIITLDIVEEVSSVVNTTGTSQNGTSGTTSGIGNAPASPGQTNVNPGPTTRKSKTTTRVHVPNEYFVILSGMIQDEDELSVQQVPCLGGLPIIGAVFTQRGHTDNKRNLMIFIRPQIVVNDQIDAITKREQDIFREKSRIPKHWEYQVDETLQWLNLKGFCDPGEAQPDSYND